MSRYASAYMPPRAPMPMAPQDFAAKPVPRRLEARRRWREQAWRVAAFAPAFGFTALMAVGIGTWLASEGGVGALEIAVIGLVCFTFLWVSLSVSTVAIGLLRRAIDGSRDAETPTQRGQPLHVALLIPTYNEVPWDVAGNASAMLKDLAGRAGSGDGDDRFTLFILSDTRDVDVAAQEEAAFHTLRHTYEGAIDVFYRRRAQNTDKKVGNISDWIENWGADYDAMLVLDADSLMSGAAIEHLARELAADPEAGLIQSFPLLIGSDTLFGRIQQYANGVYGWLLAEGLAAWSQREGNYWGHNAIIRTRAFADSARLPYLRGRDLILSHDFVEAGMLRRAGWSVRFLPRIAGSFEETPQTLIDYALRDRRWCQGNLQHLRLLTARGFHPISRFHLAQGAAAFLLSPAWFALIAIWSFLGAMPGATANYFSAANPLFPVWPESAPISGAAFLAVIYGMLLAPKLAGIVALATRARIRALYGGTTRFAATAAFEIACSVVYAPILMVQQSVAVIRAVLGRSAGWRPQQRGAARYGWGTTLLFHWVETLGGFGMLAGIFLGSISYWLLPIALSLALAAPLSKLSAVRVSDRRLAPLRLDTLHSLREPRIVASARTERAWLKGLLTDPIAAE
ncbi:MAG: glucans biosynthesis glucosyltransferase MdoH [Pseudomonadota bacterium]